MLKFKNLMVCLAFRDYLRNHPDEARDYSEIKHAAVAAAINFGKKEDKRTAYIEAKKPVILKIMEKVKQTYL